MEQKTAKGEDLVITGDDMHKMLAQVQQQSSCDFSFTSSLNNYW